MDIQKRLAAFSMDIHSTDCKLPVKGDEALNHDGSHICRCLATDWSERYMDSVIHFLDKTGADAVEIDGPYGMLMCSGGKTHRHEDFTDSYFQPLPTGEMGQLRCNPEK